MNTVNEFCTCPRILTEHWKCLSCQEEMCGACISDHECLVCGCLFCNDCLVTQVNYFIVSGDCREKKRFCEGPHLIINPHHQANFQQE